METHIKVIQVEQGSPEWFACRKGRMTSSHGQEIGNCGKGLDTLIHNIMSEYYSSGEKTHYENEDTMRGVELEEMAATMYEIENGVILEKVGFIEYGEYGGSSPDRLEGEDGLVEIKCLNDKNHFKIMLYGEKAIESKYLWQVQCQMLMTERTHCTLCFYNPNFEKSLIMFRIEADPVKQEKLKVGLIKGEEMIKQILTKLKCK